MDAKTAIVQNFAKIVAMLGHCLSVRHQLRALRDGTTGKTHPRHQSQDNDLKVDHGPRAKEQQKESRKEARQIYRTPVDTSHRMDSSRGNAPLS